MFNKLASIVSAVLLTGSVYAGHGQSCPDINEIKTEGISMAEYITSDIYLSYNISNYHTDSIWGFVMAPITAETTVEALAISNEILADMGAPGIPENSEEDELVCLYNTGHQDIIAAAINAEHMISPSKLKQYIQKYRK